MVKRNPSNGISIYSWRLISSSLLFPPRESRGYPPLLLLLSSDVCWDKIGAKLIVFTLFPQLSPSSSFSFLLSPSPPSLSLSLSLCLIDCRSPFLIIASSPSLFDFLLISILCLLSFLFLFSSSFSSSFRLLFVLTAKRMNHRRSKGSSTFSRSLNALASS